MWIHLEFDVLKETLLIFLYLAKRERGEISKFFQIKDI